MQRYNFPMITTQAACCLISSKPGVSDGTTLTGRLSQPVKCAHCDAQYRIEFVPGDAARISDYEDRLRATAQQKVNQDHRADMPSTRHTSIIGIDGISN